jgi:hypothetical protein
MLGDGMQSLAVRDATDFRNRKSSTATPPAGRLRRSPTPSTGGAKSISLP